MFKTEKKKAEKAALQLNKETLRVLNSKEIQQVSGGTPSVASATMQTDNRGVQSINP